MITCHCIPSGIKPTLIQRERSCGFICIVFEGQRSGCII